MKTITKEVYDYSELTGNAKEKAAAWLREVQTETGWWDSVYDDVITIGALMGLEINPRYHGEKDRPDLWFQLSYTQGDGACWGGSVDANKFKGAYKRVKSHAPTDNKLHEIAKGAEELYNQMRQMVKDHKAEWDDLYSYSVTSNDRYNSCDVEGTELYFEKSVRELARDFAQWIYWQLRNECDYLSSEESIKDLAEANEYTFDKYGNREG